MKKKVLLFIALIVILVTGFIFLVPVKDGRTVYKNIKYKQLLAGAVQPDNYDKMKITYLNIVDRKTGTERFNTSDGKSVDDGSVVSNMDGIDVSANDDYVRTYDVLEYTLELGVALNLDNPDVTETTQLKGGVVKVRATILEYDEYQYLFLIDEPWMNSKSYSNQGRTVTATYVVPVDETIVGGNQQLTFRLVTGNKRKEIVSKDIVQFEAWMEGNQPDSSLSVAEKKTVIDHSDLFITGKPSTNLHVTNNGGLNIGGTLNGTKGQYVVVGVGSVLSSNNDRKGTAYPSYFNNADLDIKLEYFYKDASSENSEFMPVPDEFVDNISLIAFNKNGVQNEDAYPNPTSNRAYLYTDLDKEKSATLRGYTYRNNFGNGTAQLDGDSLKINIKDFDNDFYPYHNLLNVTNNGLASAIFGYSNEFFVPYYMPDPNGSYEYQLKFSYVSAEFNNDNNESFDLYEQNVNDNYSSYLSKTITFRNYLTGDITADLYSDLILPGYPGGNNSTEAAYITVDKTSSIYGYIQTREGPYLGGEERLFTFDGSKLKLVQKDGKWYKYEETNTNAVSENTPLTNQSMKYGIYKLNPSVGLNTLALINSTLKEDFDWYDTVEEAMEHGVVSALLWDNPDYDGFGKKDSLCFYMQAVDTERDNNTVGVVRQKIWLYGDEERTVRFGKYDSIAEDFFLPSYYGESFEKLNPNGGPIGAGEGLLIINRYHAFAENPLVMDVNNNERTSFTIHDEKIRFRVKLLENGSIGSIDLDEKDTIHIGAHFSSTKYLTLLPETCTLEPVSITQSYSTEYLEWIVEDISIRDLPMYITCDYLINPMTPNGTEVDFLVNSKAYSDKYRISRNTGSYYDSEITIINLAGSSTRKTVSKEVVEPGEEFDVEGRIYNISDESLNNVKTIELLPKNGDSRNSVVNGSYTINVVSMDEGTSIFYATGDIDEIGIETDGLGYKHIKNVDLANDDRWIEVQVGNTIPSTATAIATLTDTIPTQTSKGFVYHVIPNGNQKRDIYYFGQYISSDNLVENIFSTYKSVVVVDRQISGTVFEDLNRNDLFNETDAKLNNFTVELLNEAGAKIDETATDNNGHYEFSVNNGNYYIRVTNLPDGYEVLPKGTGIDSNNINTSLVSNLINHTETPRNAVENKTVNYGIRKKPATLVVKYLDKNDNHPLVEQTEETVYYTNNYETHGLTTIPENYSLLETAGAPVADVVNSDYIEVIYYYDFTPATITAKHYIDGTSTKIHEDVIQNLKLTQPYSTSVLDTTNLNYEYVRTDGDATSGTVGKTEIVVNYYYKLKKGTVTTHHYLYDNGETTNKLAPDVTREWNYTETYTTSISDQVPQNYEFYKKSNNYTSVMGSPSVEVSYYYRLKNSSLTTSINIVGTEEITSKDTKVEYEITYNAKVSDYIGSGTITINDTLPYDIDVDNSDLDGGVYNPTDRSISWEVDWSDIDTYAGRDETTITKTISVKYNGIVGRDRIMTNNVHSNILLSNSSRDAEAQTSTNIRINGNIKVVYVDKDTGEEIADAIEETNLVGEEFISSAIEKDGYKLITKPDSETFEFEEEDQLITYEYERIKFEIKGKVLGVGGSIRGDEDVYWGEDSTEGNIIVEADEGYIIEAILVNGERMDIEPGQVTLVLENFKEVLENKNIEVVFAKKPQENPNTKAFIGLIILISWLILFTNAILLKKSQELE